MQSKQLASLPMAFTWADLVDALAEERGSLAELARSLTEVAPASAGLSLDPLTVERGLRRLRKRGNAEGDKYGRLLLRLFGVPGALETWARWMGQYHSRLSDLPTAMRRDQLRLWDRPPISESTVSIWVHIGLAGLANREREVEALERRLALARLLAKRAPSAARLELALFEAALAVDAGEREAAAGLLEAAAGLLDDAALDGDERACYFARIQDQRAYRVARGWREERWRLGEALELYAAIPEAGPAFVRFRRAHGVAWCRWRMGEVEAARAAVERAVAAAGDGGLRRPRCMALTLRGLISGEPGDLERALRIAEEVGDERLVERVRRYSSG